MDPMPSSKTCTKCGEVKPLGEYYSGRAQCRDCHKARIYAKRDEDRDAHNAKRRKYTKANPEKIAEQSARYYAAHGDEINAARRAERAENPEPIRQHERERWARNAERIAEQRRAWWVEHGEEVNARIRAQRAADPEPFRRAERASRERHRDKINERQREYYRHNFDLYARHRRMREMRLANVESDDYTRTEIFDRDGGSCRACGLELTNEPHGFAIDHIVPVALGGPDTRANVQLMCQPCNREKWARLEGQIHLPV